MALELANKPLLIFMYRKTTSFDECKNKNKNSSRSEAVVDVISSQNIVAQLMYLLLIILIPFYFKSPKH